jgi:nucleoid DNA-binding protein
MRRNRNDMARIYAKSYKISINEAKRRLDEVADVIVTELESGNDVMLNNFFNFKLRTRNAKRARDLYSGKPIIIPATKTVVVQMASPTKRKIQNK